MTTIAAEIEKIYIDSLDRAIYDKMEKELKVKKISNKDLFMIALITGFKSNIKTSINKKLEYYWTKDLTSEDEIIIKSIAISENNNAAILQDTEELVRLSQEYAHGGISVIKGILEQHGSFIKYIEKEIFEKYNKIEKT